jgi:two-component system nitrogen regulation response regulator GlnG
LLRFFLARAAQELDVETKTLRSDVEAYLATLEWPGNVRQLENLCRWLTVMASGQEVHMEDLPYELFEKREAAAASGSNWEASLKRWAERKLADGEEALLDQATPAFERIMIEAALARTSGRRQDAARLLGWGRNTLTRKIKELGLDESSTMTGS